MLQPRMRSITSSARLPPHHPVSFDHFDPKSQALTPSLIGSTFASSTRAACARSRNSSSLVIAMAKVNHISALKWSTGSDKPVCSNSPSANTDSALPALAEIRNQ
jgi:hypothetical protein